MFLLFFFLLHVCIFNDDEQNKPTRKTQKYRVVFSAVFSICIHFLILIDSYLFLIVFFLFFIIFTVCNNKRKALTTTTSN